MTKKKKDAKAAKKNLDKQLKKQKEFIDYSKPLKTAPKESGKKLNLKNLPGTKETIDEFTGGVTMNKGMGGKVQTEYRGGGAVNLGNYKGQF